MVSFGLGAASAGVGTYFMLKSSSTRNESDQLYEQCLLESGGEKCMDKDVAAEVWANDGEADHQAKLGVVGLVGGGVGIAAGITFLIVDATRGSKSASQSTPHVTPVFGFRSIDLVGTF